MKKKILPTVLAAWLCLFLGGCSPFAVFDSKTLMAPPKTNEDQQAIQNILQGTSADITFVYPKNGDYRSAILMKDFTGDGQEDAIGFTSLEDASSGVEVQFLEKSEGEWQTIASFRNTAIQVDRVCFGDLTGSGNDSVLIGWGNSAGTSGRTAAVNAYIYSDGKVTEHALGVYGEMVLADFDQDGVDEVFTVDKFLPAETEQDEPSPAKARVYAWRGGAMAQIAETDADNSIASYSAAVFGRLYRDLFGVALDGAKADGSLTTQVFCLEDDMLINYPSGVNTEEYLNEFSRPSTAPFLCRDIDGDGYLEFPIVSLLPGISEETSLDSTSYQVQWQIFRPDGAGFTRARALMNLTEGYWFRLPYQLAGKITASNDLTRRAVTYTSVTESPETGEMLLGSPLFAIRAFTRASWENRGTASGYELLASQNDVIYGIRTLTRDQDMIELIDKIKLDFRLLSE